MTIQAFGQCWEVICALRAHDEQLAAQLDELRRELGRYGGVPRLPAKIHTDFPADISSVLVDAINVRLVERTT